MQNRARFVSPLCAQTVRADHACRDPLCVCRAVDAYDIVWISLTDNLDGLFPHPRTDSRRLAALAR
ncbi:hypothetical protein BCAR13_20002 [Paraburkholderia caribensis]|nr:hypothetical protein BCAR13_20002 [Paraburkholderia caribensis]